MDIETGQDRLILSLADGVALLRESLSAEDRKAHDAQEFVHWFNHCKIAPDGRRFTVKLRWRRRDGQWGGRKSVSLTCGLDGASPRVVARTASHVMWLDNDRLYYWSTEGERVLLQSDRPISEDPATEIVAPEHFRSNVHARHLATDPERIVYDTPYRSEVALHMLDRRTGRSEAIALFPNHRPVRGAYRCDLHPVPSDDGRRIVVSSLADGCRQVYVAERKDRGE